MIADEIDCSDSFLVMMTEEAQSVIARAKAEAHVRGHSRLKREHLVKAIADSDQAVFNQIFEEMYVDPTRVIEALEEL